MCAIKSRRALKDTFVDGSYPDQQDCHDVLDSSVHKDDMIPLDRFENLQESIDQQARQAAAEAAGQCHGQECQPRTILLEGSRFNATERDIVVQPPSQEDGENETNEDDNLQEDDETGQMPATVQHLKESSITILGPASLADRIIAIIVDGKTIMPNSSPSDQQEDNQQSQQPEE